MVLLWLFATLAALGATRLHALSAALAIRVIEQERA
jgi:hypothetical protein